MKRSGMHGFIGCFVCAVLLLSAGKILSASYTSADSVIFSQGDYEVTRRFDNNNEWIHTCRDTSVGSSIEVYQRGANLKKFIAVLHDIRYSVIHSNGNFRMMPWPNRTKDGRFTDAQGTTHNLFERDNAGDMMTSDDGNGNAIHGMVRDKLWHVEEAGADSEGVFIRCYFDTEGFSVINEIFGAFRDYSIFRLKGNTLIIDSYVQNKADEPFENCGWGYHPFFNTPMEPLDGSQEGSKERCSLLLPATQFAPVDSKKIPTGTLESVSSYNNGYYDFTALRSINNVNMDTYFTGLVKESGQEYTRTLLIDYGNQVRLQLLGDYPAYPWMVIFNPNRSSFICIEHQTEEVNGLNTRENLITIPANSTCPRARIQIIADDDTTDQIPTRIASHNTGDRKHDIQLCTHGTTITWNTGTNDVSVECSIYTMQGVLIATLKNGIQRERSARIVWDETDTYGRAVANGVYVVKLRVSRVQLARTMTVHR